jgi:hypothetical protein
MLSAAVNAQVVESARGRGVQQNRGLQAATGDWCLFVHADTELPIGYDSLMSQAINEHIKHVAKPAQWGCFKSIQATGVSTKLCHFVNRAIPYQGNLARMLSLMNIIMFMLPECMKPSACSLLWIKQLHDDACTTR